MKKIVVPGIMVVAVVVLAFSPLVPQAADEATQSAVRQAALDYIEGWFEGNAERMDRALHPQLAKRLVAINPQTGQEMFTHLTKEQMVEFTRKGGGSRLPADKRGIKVTILDMTKTMAFVRSDCSQFIDYLTLAKCEGGQWKIVNVLWENVTK
ncbi:MAG: nuclear transport factor 2 family protein [Candidatus Aminicenantes bacterium]|nr:nuclear transport factor 2 family protein [Candidatus Aminicenantes bacterium]